MIARNERAQISKRLTKAHQKTLAHKQLSGQLLLNAILWQLIRNMVKNNVEDFDEALDAALTMPKKDLEQVPANFALKLDGDEENVTVISTFIKPKSNILLADGSQAPSGNNDN